MIHMLALALSLSVHGNLRQAPSEAKWHTRTEFFAAQHKIQGWTKAQVKALLGPPDNIETSPYGSQEPYEVWRYGTDGHGGLALLGVIEFSNDKEDWAGPEGTPPSASIISDEEMTRLLRAMATRNVDDELACGRDPLRLIQVANLLIPLGQEKAMAVLGEYARYENGQNYLDYVIFSDYWLFMLARVMFTSRAPGGVFPAPLIGFIGVTPPKSMTKWPTFPVVLNDDIPLSLISGVTISGVPEPFESYFAKNKADWVIRPTKLRPPGDPFQSTAAFLATSAWTNLVGTDSSYESGVAYGDIASLVRNCGPYKIDGPDFSGARNLDSFENFAKVHQQFLKVGGHWDADRQLYVRKDGSFTPDRTIDSPEFAYTFKEIKGLQVTATAHRRNKSEVYFSWTALANKKEMKLPNLIVRDISTKEVIDKSDLEAEKANYGTPGHEPGGGYGWRGGLSGHFVAHDRKLSFVMILGGKEYVSPPFTP